MSKSRQENCTAGAESPQITSIFKENNIQTNQGKDKEFK